MKIGERKLPHGLGRKTMENRDFKIIRFRRDNDFNVIGRRVIKKNLTEAEAKEHCSREDTHGKMWFDGFTNK